MVDCSSFRYWNLIILSYFHYACHWKQLKLLMLLDITLPQQIRSDWFWYRTALRFKKKRRWAWLPMKIWRKIFLWKCSSAFSTHYMLKIEKKLRKNTKKMQRWTIFLSQFSTFLFTRSKGHGSGCTTALSGMHRYLYRVYCLTPPTSLCSDNTQNLHSSTVERIPMNVLATHPTLWS